MRISAQDIAAAFRDLIADVRSREDIASWASMVRASDDTEGLEFVPPRAASAIWDALEFLMGVDLKDGPNSYLHNQVDFEKYWSAKKGALLS